MRVARRSVNHRVRRVTNFTAGLVLTAAMAASGGARADDAADTLTIAVNGTPLSFDPAHADNGNGVIYTQLAYEPLIRAGSDGAFQPGLATSWSYVGGDNKQFELTLRKGVKFSDGTDVTTQAVAASLNYFVANATGPTSAAFKGNQGHRSRRFQSDARLQYRQSFHPRFAGPDRPGRRCRQPSGTGKSGRAGGDACRRRTLRPRPRANRDRGSLYLQRQSPVLGSFGAALQDHRGEGDPEHDVSAAGAPHRPDRFHAG